MFIPGLGNLPVARQQELRVILTARDMAEGGSWLVPHFLGHPRLRKPPFMYWAVASSFRLFDPDTSSAAVARVPAVLFGTSLIIVLYLCGSDFVGRARAFVGALLAATTYLFIRHGQIAETDMTLTLFITLATWCGYRAMRIGAPARWWLAAGLFMGVAFLVKGPAAIAMPLLAWCAFAWTGRTGGLRRPLAGIAVALALCAVVALPWYADIFLGSSDAMAARQQVGTELDVTFAQSSHKGAIYYYLFLLPRTLMPWGVFLPFALFGMWRYGRRHDGARFLMGWFATSLVALSLISSKQEHYSVLLLPASALILGWFVRRGATLCRIYPQRFVWSYLHIVSALLALAGALLVAYPLYVQDGPRFMVSACGVLILVLFAVTWSWRDASRLLAAMACGVAVIANVYSLSLYVRHDPRTVFTAFTEQAGGYLRTASTVFVVGPHKTAMEYYIHRRLHREETMKEAVAEAGTNDVIVETGNMEHPLGAAPADCREIMELDKKDIRCVLYAKSTAATEVEEPGSPE